MVPSYGTLIIILQYGLQSKGKSCALLTRRDAATIILVSYLSKMSYYRAQLWEVYKERRCVRTYYGHRQAVRDISFDNDGKRFLSAAYDRYVKLWDTETGACISRFTSRKIPYCAKFNPDPDKQHLFVAGTSDKKIICVSIMFCKEWMKLAHIESY